MLSLAIIVLGNFYNFQVAIFFGYLSDFGKKDGEAVGSFLHVLLKVIWLEEHKRRYRSNRIRQPFFPKSSLYHYTRSFVTFGPTYNDQDGSF